MSKYFVFTLLFLLAVFLWVSTIFWLVGKAAGCVGFVATILTAAVVVYGYQNSEEV